MMVMVLVMSMCMVFALASAAGGYYLWNNRGLFVTYYLWNNRGGSRSSDTNINVSVAGAGSGAATNEGSSTTTTASATTTTAVPGSGLTTTGDFEYKCIQSPDDKCHWLKVKMKDGAVVCAGPDAKACFWETSEDGCKKFEEKDGFTCTQKEAGWCKIAVSGTTEKTCIINDEYKCIVSKQGDKCKWLMYKKTKDGSITCMGPNKDNCYWSDSKAECEAKEKKDAFTCTQTTTGWCKDAQAGGTGICTPEKPP